jgi:hypothetical protein
MDRREFTSRALMAMLAGVTVTITGCGSDNGVAPTAAPGVKLGTISNNHGHEVVLTSAQQLAGGNVTLTFLGDSTHSHTLELTAAEVATIRDGVRVEKGCLMARNHMHTVAFN